MNTITISSIALIVLGAILIFYPTLILPDTSTNSMITSISNNNTVIGGVLIAAGGYMYYTYGMKTTKSSLQRLNPMTLPTESS